MAGYQVLAQVLVRNLEGRREWDQREWDKTRMVWPHRCHYTGKRLMPGTKVMRSRISTGHGLTSILYCEYVARWTTEDELLIQKIKGNG